MDLNYIKTYVEVVKTHSLSKASEKLHMSQPGVTVQIQKLEKEIGCKLFIRGNKRFSLTIEGKKFFRFAEYVLVEHNNFLSEIAKLREGVTGNINVVSSPILGEFLLPSLLSRYKADYNTIDIDFKIVSDSFAVLKEIQKQNNTIGFCATKPSQDDIESIVIGEDEIVLIVYPSHPFAHYKEVSIYDMVGENFIFRDKNDTNIFKEIFSANFKKTQYYIDQCQTKLVLGTLNGVILAVESKTGIALISSQAIKNAEAMGTIKVAKIKNLNLKRYLYCIYKPATYENTTARTFIDYVKLQNSPTNSKK